MGTKTAQQVLEEHTAEWLSIPGVVGAAVGECAGQPCIRILSAQETDRLVDRIPSEVGGYRVVIEETGPLEAL
ncbi:MAG: hypothetical protein R6V05_15605 [Candidatus Brocadiia bacterium]